MATEVGCTCGSGKAADRCCDRFLNGGDHARTPEQLMRSRYTAYARGGLGEYLLHTWHPATAAGLSVPQLSERSHDWERLEVMARSQSGDNAEVEFRAWYRDDAGDLQCQHELSQFNRLAGRWLYVGAITS
jgi:SEC-C motif-containing protein